MLVVMTQMMMMMMFTIPEPPTMNTFTTSTQQNIIKDTGNRVVGELITELSIHRKPNSNREIMIFCHSCSDFDLNHNGPTSRLQKRNTKPRLVKKYKPASSKTDVGDWYQCLNQQLYQTQRIIESTEQVG